MQIEAPSDTAPILLLLKSVVKLFDFNSSRVGSWMFFQTPCVCSMINLGLLDMEYCHIINKDLIWRFYFSFNLRWASLKQQEKDMPFHCLVSIHLKIVSSEKEIEKYFGLFICELLFGYLFKIRIHIVWFIIVCLWLTLASIIFFGNWLLDAGMKRRKWR